MPPEGRLAKTIALRFCNHTKGIIEIFWIDYDGDQVKFQDLEQGTSVTQQTDVSHPWVGKNNRGELYPQ